MGSPAGEITTQNEQVQPDQSVAPTEQNTDLFSGTQINPDELPDELKPLARQLQAAFTQKTQTLAEERRQIEALGDPEVVQQAVDLYSRITDPTNWVQLHRELTEAMQQYGMTPAEAQATADEVVTAAAQTPIPNLDEIDDPELAPLAKMLKAHQAELDRLKSSQQTIEQDRQQEEANRAAEYQRQAFLGELQRQENAIRAAHPDWSDEKIEAAYELSSFYGGNLAQGAARLEALLSQERELYLTQKASALNETGTHPAPRGAGLQSTRIEQPETIRDAEAGALEFLNARMSE